LLFFLFFFFPCVASACPSCNGFAACNQNVDAFRSLGALAEECCCFLSKMDSLNYPSCDKTDCVRLLYPYLTKHDWVFYDEGTTGPGDHLFIPHYIPDREIIDRIHRLKRLHGDFIIDGVSTFKVTRLIGLLKSKLIIRGVDVRLIPE